MNRTTMISLVALCTNVAVCGAAAVAVKYTKSMLPLLIIPFATLTVKTVKS